MNRIFILTGATGHLGSYVLDALTQRGEQLRVLIMEHEEYKDTDKVTYLKGDLTKRSSLEKLFLDLNDVETILIHMAAIINLDDRVASTLWKVNVKGTLDLMDLAMRHKVSKVLYISSVHAIPKEHPQKCIVETKDFSPELVHGGYAKTKAEAAMQVYRLIDKGLPAVLLFPSGIIGHDPKGTNNSSDFIYRAINNKFPVRLSGNYDFVDVRDVAQGILSAVDKGRIGEGYILSNRNYSLMDILDMVASFTKAKKGTFIPNWMLKLNMPLVRMIGRLLGEKDIITDYSLHVLETQDRFSHDKATKELDYYPRDLFFTIQDMVQRLHERVVSQS